MTNFEKIYHRVAIKIIKRCHGAIKITKHGKIVEVYDLKRHIWSDGLAGLIIKEECRLADLKDWEGETADHSIFDTLSTFRVIKRGSIIT